MFNDSLHWRIHSPCVYSLSFYPAGPISAASAAPLGLRPGAASDAHLGLGRVRSVSGSGPPVRGLAGEPKAPACQQKEPTVGSLCSRGDGCWCVAGQGRARRSGQVRLLCAAGVRTGAGPQGG